MQTVDRVITKAWRTLPAVVLSYQAFANPETRAPSSRVQRTILPILLSETAEGYRFSAVHWRRKHEVSGEVAAAITARLDAAGDRLSVAVEWHRFLLLEYLDWVEQRESEPTDSPQEWLMVPSLDLARRRGAPDDDAADHARAAMYRKAGPPGAPTAKDVQRYLRRNARTLDELLNRTWAGGYRHPEGGDLERLRSILDAFHDAGFTAQQNGWVEEDPGRDRALREWNGICEVAPPGLGDSLVQLATSAPERPRLLGTADAKESYALDRPIADRVSRIFKGADAVVVQPLNDDGPMTPPSFAGVTAAALAEGMIAASPQPCGLSESFARALVLVAHRMTLHVAWQPDRRSRDLALRAVSSTSDRYFMRRWNQVGWAYRTAAEPGSTLGRMLESPAPLFIGRMWTRAARTQFQEALWRPDARMAWEHAYGVFRSVIKDAPTLYHYSQQTGRIVSINETHAADEVGEPQEEFRPTTGADLLEAAARRLDTVINQVLDVARARHGFDAVADFLIAAEAGDGSQQNQWDAWCAATAHPDRSLPGFDQVRQHLVRRRGGANDDVGDSRAPVLDDVVSIAAFIRRSSRSGDAVKDMFGRVATEPDIATDRRAVALWASWCDRYRRHHAEIGDEGHVIPTFAQMVVLVRSSNLGADDRWAGSE